MKVLQLNFEIYCKMLKYINKTAVIISDINIM